MINPRISFIVVVTTDFSPLSSPIKLVCQLISAQSTILAEQQLQWTDVHREIKVEFQVPSNFKNGKVIVNPVQESRSPDNFLGKFVNENIPHVVGVSSGIISTEKEDIVYREFNPCTRPLRIAEQSGETIIRHVWDAGVILAAAFSLNSPFALPNELQDLLSSFIGNTRPLNVLELGCGVGILGVTIAAVLPMANVILTDLVDAQSLVQENIRLNSLYHPKINASFRILDWEQIPYPVWTQTERFDLIVMADVTYNTSTFVPLADTLQYLLKTGSKNAKVICCSKRRHDEEEEFWRIIQRRGFVVEQREVFAMDLDGSFRHCTITKKKDEGKLIDFVKLSWKHADC